MLTLPANNIRCIYMLIFNSQSSSVYPDGKHLSVLFQQQQKWKLFRQQLVEDMIYRNSLLKQNMPI